MGVLWIFSKLKVAKMPPVGDIQEVILIKPPPVAPFIPKEQLFYSKLLLDVKAPSPGWKESDIILLDL